MATERTKTVVTATGKGEGEERWEEMSFVPSTIELELEDGSTMTLEVMMGVVNG